MKKIFLLPLFLFASEYGNLYFEGNCKMCHHINKNISAPSIKLVKQKYIDVFKHKKYFVKYMANWVANPNKSTSIMQDQIQKYGLMPQLGFDKSTLEVIAKYIYETDFK